MEHEVHVLLGFFKRKFNTILRREPSETESGLGIKTSASLSEKISSNPFLGIGVSTTGEGSGKRLKIRLWEEVDGEGL